MTNKKTLKELFKFFPKANWITQDKSQIGIISIHIYKPVMCRTWTKYDHWSSDIGSESHIDNKLINVDWGNKKTWDKRIVSREEVFNDKYTNRS